jgi:hypothetical protein
VRRYKLAAFCGGLLVAASGTALLVHFFISQGLTKASLWASVLAFGLTGVGTVAIVWTLVLMIRQGDGQAKSYSSGEDLRPSTLIKQVNFNGPNIAHSGDGDINYSGPEK